MPIIRKVMPIGGSEGITLPKSWFDLDSKNNRTKKSPKST